MSWEEHKANLELLIAGGRGDFGASAYAALAEIARLEARAVPPWSDARPTVAGTYWWRYRREDLRRPEPGITFISDPSQAYNDCQFSGPIPEPPEAE